jgi:phage-related holin
MRIVNIILLFVVHFLMLPKLYSQKTTNSSYAELFKINQAYLKYEDLSMDLVCNYYSNYTTSKIEETALGKVKKKGVMQWSVMLGTETLVTKDYTVVIDSSEKMLMVGNPMKKLTQAITLIDIENISKLCKEIKYKDINSKQGCYKITYKPQVNISYEQVDLIYNKTTYLADKMVFYYKQDMTNEGLFGTKKTNEKPRLEITFSKIDTDTKISVEFFSESKYFTIKRGKITPSSKYINYHLINQKT